MSSAIFVMWDRQVKEYFRNRQRMLVSLMQPLLFLVSFGYGIGSMYSQNGGGNYIQFLIPGIIGMTLMMSSTMNGISLIWDKQFGFLKETLVAPVSRTSLLFGRCLGGATTSTIQGLLVLGMGYFMGFRITNWFLFPVALISMFAIALLFNLLGTGFASKFDDMHSFPVIMNFLVMPMFFLSGALFPISNFPSVIQTIATLNPFTYCVNLLKFGFGVGGGLFPGVFVVIGFITLLGFIGTYLFGKLEP